MMNKIELWKNLVEARLRELLKPFEPAVKIKNRDNDHGL